MGEREEQDECFSPSASPQQPQARQGECREWEAGQLLLNNGLPHKKDIEGREEESEMEVTAD